MDVSELIAELVERLHTKPRELSLQAAYDLGNAIHAAMVDWPEMNWVTASFEDAASNLVIAARCVERDESMRQDDINRYGKPFSDDDTDRLRELRENGGL